MSSPARRTLAYVLAALLLGAGLLSAAPAAQAGPGAREARLKAVIKNRRVTRAKFEDVGLEDFVKWLRLATGQNIVLRRVALAKAGIEPDDIQVRMNLEDVTIETLLKLVLEPHDLATVVKGNVLYITTRADSLGKPFTKLYAIAHITWTKIDFMAPEINLRPSNYTPVDEYEPERIVEDDPLNTGDAVAEILQEIVAPGEWDNEGWGIRATDRYLVIRAPRAVHAEVNRALAIIASLK